LLVDTHCHLNFENFDTDRLQVIQRARQAGVVHILNPAVDLSSSQASIDLAETYEEVFAAVGVHPNDSHSWNEDTKRSLRELAKHPKVVAIGEIGLDYYRDRAPQAVQQRVFQEQLHLAAELGLPVVIHMRNKSLEDRKAAAEVLEFIAGWCRDLEDQSLSLKDCPGVLHSFSEDRTTALRAIELKFLIGVTGPVTFRNASILHDVVSAVPLESILIETDAPFLTPHPHRGERNEPAYVQFVAEKIAQIRDTPYQSVSQKTTKNAERLFRWQAIK
jgi:TatD DNase family protein